MTLDELNNYCLTLTGKTLDQRGALTELAKYGSVEPITISKWKQRGEAPDNAATELIKLRAQLQHLISG